jgi:hypothetical protein
MAHLIAMKFLNKELPDDYAASHDDGSERNDERIEKAAYHHQV